MINTICHTLAADETNLQTDTHVNLNSVYKTDQITPVAIKSLNKDQAPALLLRNHQVQNISEDVNGIVDVKTVFEKIDINDPEAINLIEKEIDVVFKKINDQKEIENLKKNNESLKIKRVALVAAGVAIIVLAVAAAVALITAVSIFAPPAGGLAVGLVLAAALGTPILLGLGALSGILLSVASNRLTNQIKDNEQNIIGHELRHDFIQTFHDLTNDQKKAYLEFINEQQDLFPFKSSVDLASDPLMYKAHLKKMSLEDLSQKYEGATSKKEKHKLGGEVLKLKYEIIAINQQYLGKLKKLQTMRQNNLNEKIDDLRQQRSNLEYKLRDLNHKLDQVPIDTKKTKSRKDYLTKTAATRKEIEKTKVQLKEVSERLSTKEIKKNEMLKITFDHRESESSLKKAEKESNDFRAELELGMDDYDKKVLAQYLNE